MICGFRILHWSAKSRVSQIQRYLVYFRVVTNALTRAVKDEFQSDEYAYFAMPSQLMYILFASASTHYGGAYWGTAVQF